MGDSALQREQPFNQSKRVTSSEPRAAFQVRGMSSGSTGTPQALITDLM
jgi:phenylacetate-coenzyme A ligase PaaK-like adenylate-forming protein